jgi:transcriptional regulator with XRE-family HTH domain
MKVRVPYLYLVHPVAPTEPMRTIAKSSSAILPSQLRSARALLDWSRSECARQTGLSPETIKNIEHGIYTPNKESCARVFETFTRYGIEFIRHETTINIPAPDDQAAGTATVTYAGAVLVSSAFHKGEVND